MKKYVVVLLFLLWKPAHADVNDCLMEALANAGPDTTVAELRSGCRDKIREETLGTSAIAKRISAERQANRRDYTITPHRPNYILPYTYNDEPNLAPLGAIDDAEIENEEAVLQVSIKFPLVQNLWDTNTDLIFAYTNRAWWQVYNDDFSKPFRETNYEPEVFLRHFTEREFLGIKMVGWDFGYNHQSNGRSEVLDLSRSWDRLMGQVAFELDDDLALSLRAWYRLPEDDEDDENPNEYKYLGYGDARFIYTPNRNTFTLMYRPGTEEHTFEATWSRPITDHLRIFAQYYNGYGESLLDYDAKTERFGIGFAINDYLTR